MEKTKEQLEARKLEILQFLSRHYKQDPDKLNNFVAKYPDYSETDLTMDPSSEANEVADYESELAIEQTLENELNEIEEKLANIA